MFQIKRISDLTLLPPCKENLKLHISRANDVANMYVNAIKLHMCVDDPTYHGWKQDGTVQWKDDCFLENIDNVLELLTEKMMIMLANTNLLMTKSAIPVTLKDRWCYDNVDATTDVDFCTFNF